MYKTNGRAVEKDTGPVDRLKVFLHGESVKFKYMLKFNCYIITIINIYLYFLFEKKIELNEGLDVNLIYSMKL